MRAKQAGAYMDNWRKEVSECSDDLGLRQEGCQKALRASFSKEDLRQLILSKGIKGSGEIYDRDGG
ncbi:MAG: hypothetical protein R2865_00690 [Deinococcales bacterium]